MKLLDYTCDPLEDITGNTGKKIEDKIAFKAGINHIIHSNLLDAINDCSRSLKCTMVLNHKGYKHDFRLCRGIPIKMETPVNIARRNMIYKKGN